MLGPFVIFSYSKKNFKSRKILSLKTPNRPMSVKIQSPFTIPVSAHVGHVFHTQLFLFTFSRVQMNYIVKNTKPSSSCMQNLSLEKSNKLIKTLLLVMECSDS